MHPRFTTCQTPVPLLDQPPQVLLPPVPRPCSIHFTPITLKHESHRVTPVFSAFLCHLQLGHGTFHVPGPVLHSSCHFPTKCTKISCHAVFAHDVRPKPTRTSALRGRLPRLSPVSTATDACLHCNICPAATGACEHGGLPLARCGSVREGTVSSATVYSLSGM